MGRRKRIIAPAYRQPNRLTDHARPLPAAVIARGAATWCPHGFTTHPNIVQEVRES